MRQAEILALGNNPPLHIKRRNQPYVMIGGWVGGIIHHLSSEANNFLDLRYGK
jgi:hypothetical protein